MKYRKNPVIVDAVQFDGTPSGANVVFDSFDIPGARFVPHANNLECGILIIPTPQGDLMASEGDWIIKKVKTEFCHCKKDVFSATYEPV